MTSTSMIGWRATRVIFGLTPETVNVISCFLWPNIQWLNTTLIFHPRFYARLFLMFRIIFWRTSGVIIVTLRSILSLALSFVECSYIRHRKCSHISINFWFDIWRISTFQYFIVGNYFVWISIFTTICIAVFLAGTVGYKFLWASILIFCVPMDARNMPEMNFKLLQNHYTNIVIIL